MGFERTVPRTVNELGDYLTKLHENAGHVKSINVNSTNAHLEVDLDWMANTKYPDVFIPLKRGKVHEAKALIERVLTRSRSGFGPTSSDAQELFDMIDPSGQ
jgi:hypothetical protein